MDATTVAIVTMAIVTMAIVGMDRYLFFIILE